jgi:hypothetical protein
MPRPRAVLTRAGSLRNRSATSAATGSRRRSGNILGARRGRTRACDRSADDRTSHRAIRRTLHRSPAVAWRARARRRSTGASGIRSIHRLGEDGDLSPSGIERGVDTASQPCPPGFARPRELRVPGSGEPTRPAR